jgi:hypothetical protein
VDANTTAIPEPPKRAASQICGRAFPAETNALRLLTVVFRLSDATNCR